MENKNQIFGKISPNIKKSKISFFIFVILFFIFGINIGQADAAITYVGGRGAGRAGATSTVTVPINAGLTGGSGAAAIAGDLVVVTISTGTAARQPVVTPTGYTALTAQRTTATTYDTNVQTSYKFMPATPDVSVIIPSTGSNQDGQGYTVHVFRGVDSASPLDTTSTYAVGTANNRPNPAAITPLSSGAWIYFGGGGAAATGTTLYTASYLTSFLTYNGADTNDGTVGAGYYSAWSSGAYDGAVWTGGSAVTTSSWGATSVVLKPQANAVPTVTTPTVTGITTSGATLGANVTSAGYPATVTARGTCWATTAAPTINCSTVAGTTGVFTGPSAGSMPSGTLIYYRGYADNSTGRGYSSPDGTFTTLAPPTTLGNGTDGSSSTIAPGAVETEIDRFSLIISSGSDTVTGMTVTLAGNASAYTNISLVDVQTIAGVSKCSLTPTSNTVLLTGCAIGVTTSLTEYKILITPKIHANMSAVPGASYATTATVTSITATNTPAGTDSGSATITVDNASPSAVTASTATAGDTVIDLTWTNPSDSDFTTNGTVVVLRHLATAVSTVPVEGTTYTVGNIISATDTVACVITGSAPATTCQDTGLTNSTVYHYKIFTRDSNGNYNTGTVPTGSPATPAVANVNISSISNQSFIVGQASTPISTITITDKITTPVITAANDIRIKIPATFNMTWDETDTIATIGGGAQAKASTTVSYEDLNKTLVINVTTNFVASDSITISGLSFKNFSAVSSADNLEFEVDNAGTTADTDDKTIAISSALVPYWQDGKSVGNLTSTVDWQEISGITQSTLPANSAYLWMQSDGSINKIFAVDTSNASSMGEWTLSGVTGVDYEDLSSARINNQSYIYLADIGDNASARSTITVYRIIEPTVTGSNGTVAAPNIETITMQYPSGSMPSLKDAETFLVDPDTGDMYIVTKREAVPGVYFLAHAASYSGTQTLTDLGNMFDIPDVASIAATGNAVGGNISPNGREILIKSYDVMYLFSRNKSTQTIIQALQGTPTEVTSYVGGGSTTYRKSHPSQEPQGEAVTFSYYGNDYYTASEFVATEGSTATRYPLFKYDRLTDTPTSTTLQQGVSPDGTYAGTLDTYIWDTNPDLSYGTEITIVADLTDTLDVQTDQRKGLLKFDVSSIPSNATIVGARLDLDVTVEGQGWKMHRMLVDWNESSTYNSLTAGVDDDNIDASSVEDNRNGVTLDTIVGSIRNNMNIATVQGWVDGTYPNYGWLLESTNIDGQQFVSKEGATSTQRPKLIISYIGSSSAPTISSAGHQIFTVGDSVTAISTISITDADTPTITNTNDIRIKIPATFNMTWDETDTLATIGGGAQAKASTTVSYEDLNKTLVINVTTNFVASDSITVSGLSFKNFSAVSSADNLELEIDNAGTVVDVDDKTITINLASMLVQNASFVDAYEATAILNSITSTLNTSATANNLLVTAIATDKSAGTYTVPTGFTRLGTAYIGGSVSCDFAYKIATGGETNITWNYGTASRGSSMWLGEYEGLMSSNVLDTTASADSNNIAVNSQSTGTTAVTSQPDELAISFFGIDSSEYALGSRSWTNGFTERDYLSVVSVAGLGIAEKVLSSTGSQESTVTWAPTTDQSCGGIATFKIISGRISGTLTSSVYDTTANTSSIGYNSIMWKGTLGGAGLNEGKVKFQFAASASSSGPWNYYGGSTCGALDWFDPLGPDNPIELKGLNCLSAWNNKRYYRYKVKVCSNDCVAAGPNTPIINKIIVNWSP